MTAPVALSAGQEKEAREEHALRNENLDYRFAVNQGRIISRRLKNKLANEVVELPEADFALEFEGGKLARPADFTARIVRKDAGNMEILYSPAAPAVADLQVRVKYTLLPSKHYLRKQVSLRQSGRGEPRRLMRADLDIWKGVRRDWKSAIADRIRYGSHPIYCDTMWAGLEFVAAHNEYSHEGFVLSSRPGGKALTSDWWKLHSTVVGVAEPDQPKESFLRYIDDVRLAPPRLVACYNTWWSLPEIFNEKNCLALVESVVNSLYGKHGVFFDYVTLDMGWSHPQTVWEVNKKDFPNGLTAINDSVNSAKGKLGLWMSPSEVYRPVIDYDWAAKKGYVVVKFNEGSEFQREGISLADPVFCTAVKDQLKRLVSGYQLGQLKFDGFVARENAAHHSLLPGEDSVEPLAERSLELLAAAREANPDLFTEPTYLNSLANYISPWITKYSTSVWGNAGGDCPVGLVPAPDHRESQTTAREYFIFASLQEIWLPQNALHYFDIVHCDPAGGFPNHAAMAFGRGRFFVSTYINPKVMSESDWELFAGLLKWARRNEEILRNTVVLPSRVELCEPYAYAHWSGSHGIVAVRNPSNESQKYTLEMVKAGAPKELSSGVCYAQYPYRKGVQEGLTGTSALTLELAPWELVFLEIVPRNQLAEPVALGARWERDWSGSMKIASEGSDNIRLLLPRAGEQVVSAKPLAAGNPMGEILSQKLDRLPESSWLRHKDKPLPTASFELQTEITLPPGPVEGKALLLMQFPGKDHLPSTCSCLVNGRTVTLKETSSEGHIGYDMVGPQNPYRTLMPFVSHWNWYVCDLDGGLSRVVFGGQCPCESCKMGLWVWADWDLGQQSLLVSVECPEPDMPQLEPHRKRQGVCILQPGIPNEPPPSEARWRLA